MPPSASSLHPAELLLCGYHFRASQASFQAAGAAAYGKTGMPVMTGTRGADAPGRVGASAGWQRLLTAAKSNYGEPA